MRKYTTSNGTFYYPEQFISLIDTEELKIIVENPAGYGEGDLVRMFYTSVSDDVQAWVNTFEIFSPLVKAGAILRAVFYLPLSAEFANDSISFNPHLEETVFCIKTKGATDFLVNRNILDSKASFIYLTTRAAGILTNPIPVFFFSERGAGLFANKILNRQSWVADTNFSSVAIRQDKFNPYDMGGGRNLFTDAEGELHENNSAGTGVVVVFTQSIILTRNTEYVLSFDVKGSGLASFVASDYTSPISAVASNGAVGSTDGGIIDFDITGTWVRVWVKITTGNWANETHSKPLVIRARIGADVYVKKVKLEEGSIATDYTPNPEDYEVTEVVSGADLAGGLAKFNSSYAFKLLDDSEWVAKKLICPENYIQLFWGEPRTETRFSFWFKIKEIEKSSEAWGEVEHYRELRAGTDVKERRKDVTKYRFPKTKLRLTSGVFRQDIIDKLKGMAHSPTIYKYNPYTKLNEGRGVIAQVTEMWRAEDGSPTPQLGAGHFKLNYIYTLIYSNTIEELVNSPESVFDLEFSFKGDLNFVYFLQNRDDWETRVVIQPPLIADNWLKKTYTNSIVIDRGKKVKPALVTSTPQTPASLPEIKDIYIKGSLGGIEDVEVEIATMNIIPHQDGESEMELTVISDDFRKPDYLYF